jgi:hypothetical protein
MAKNDKASAPVAEAKPVEDVGAAAPAVEPSAQPAPVADAPKPGPRVGLHEFCIRLSGKDKRVEMISAFESVERRAGRLQDAEVAYADRYTKFIKQPA